MKILRIIPSMNPKLGGPCQGIRNSIPALKDLGVENEVVCMDEENAAFLKKDNFVIHAVGTSKTSWSYNPALEVWMKNNYQNYDAIIIHGLWQYHSYVSFKTMLKNRESNPSPKVYVMPHGMLDPWFQRDKSRRLKALRNEIYWRIIEKNVVNDADGVLFTCEQELILARETFSGYKPKREINIGYGIPNPPHEYNIKEDKIIERPYWLFLSRIHPKKGVDLLIDTYQELYSESRDIPDLVIAGSVDSEYAREMMEKAKVCDRIHFPGMLQGDFKWRAFYGCEAFVLPSHQENFGIAVVEALACAKPVLISDQVNIWREIESNNAGIIGKDSKEGITDILKKWLSLSQRKKTEMGKNAKQTYITNFSVEPAAARLKNVLENI